MPSWKKVIISGSDAALHSLIVTNGITGSLFGTSSWALNTATASYVNPLVQNVVITGSLLVSGSTTQIGNNNLQGTTTLSGSINISGNTFLTGSLTALNQTASFGYVSASFLDITGKQVVRGYSQYLPTSDVVPITTVGGYVYSSGSQGDLYFAQTNGTQNNVTRLRWIEGNMYTGLLNGAVISTASSTAYNVSSGSGIIVTMNGSLSADPYPTVQYISWGNLSASIAPLSASYDQSFIAIEPSGSTGIIHVSGIPYNDGQFNTLIPIGNVIHQNRSSINAIATYPSVAYGYKQRTNDFIRAFGPLKLSGLNTYVSGSSTGSLIVVSGTAYSDGRNYTTDPNNPSYITDPGTATSKIYRYRQSGSAWVYDTNGGAGYGAIDPTNYSLNGVLTPVPGNGSNRKWTIQRVYFFPAGATKGIYVYYGNETYASQLEATANIPFEDFVEAPNTAAGAILSAYIVVRNNADFTDSTSYNIQQGGLFRNVGGSGGGGSAVTQTLAGLSDVAIVTPTNGQPLVYDSTSLKWENKSTLTANLTGTASFATQAVSASYALTASYFGGSITSASYAATSSFVTGSNVYGPYGSNSIISASYATNAETSLSSSYAATASLAPLYLPLTGGTVSGSLTIIGPFNQGSSSLSSGTYTHAQGFRVTASAPYSHAEGVSTQATQTGAHAEGFRTLSSGVYSHTEGGYVTASGFYSHAEGSGSKATNYAAHAEGILTLSSGQGSHTEGINTWAYGTGSHAEGYITTASGDYSHAEGGFTVASNIGAHAEGTQTQATGQYSHAEGYITVASGEQSHAEGLGSIASGTGAHAEGGTTHATGFYSHAEGSSTYSPGEGAHAEGSGTVALGATSHTEGVSTNTGVTTGYKITSSTPGVLILGSTYGDISLKFVIGSTIILHNSAGDTVGTTTVSSTSWNGTNTTVNLTNTYYDPGTDSVIGNISYGVANWGGDQILAGKNAHAEGISSVAIGNNSHAEGNYAEAWGDSSHAEGNYTTAVGKYSHAEGVGFLVGTEISVTTSATIVIDLVTPDITLSSTSVISINTSTLVISGDYSAITFPQPLSSLTLYDGATTLPINFSFYKKTPVLASATYDGGLNETTFAVDAQFESIYYSVQGTGLIATEDYSHAEGLSTLAVSPGSHAEGAYTIAQGTWSHAEGQGTKASGQTSHTEGYQTTASGNWAHAEGWITVAETGYSHTEGYLTSATGTGAHAEGSNTTAQGVGSHAEGEGSQANGVSSHAEGYYTVAAGNYSHAEGYAPIAYGIGSHAEGYITKARGQYSHAEGYYTVASGSYQHVQGQYNISSSAQSAFIIGNGTADNARSNLIYASGSNVQITGSLQVKGSTFHSGSIFVTSSAVTLAQFDGNQNGYVEFSIRNTSNGISASGDIAVYADNGTVSNNYIDMGINNSGMTGTYSYFGTDFGNANDAYVYNVGGDLRIGNATSVAPFSQSFYLFSNSTATPNITITGSQVAINKSANINSNFDISGSTLISGSLRGQVNALTIASNTASINLASNNFFTVTLVNAANTHISASNILPGQTANIKVLQGSAGTGTVSFNSAIKSGSFYTGSAVANATDIVTFISFDSSTLYMSAVTNLK